MNQNARVYLLLSVHFHIHCLFVHFHIHYLSFEQNLLVLLLIAEHLLSSLKKHFLKSGSNSSLSPSSYVQNSKSTFSCSSMFWFSLYQSSSLSSESHWQLGNLPSLPHPPSFDRSISAHDSKAPLVISGDLDNLYDEKNSEVHMIDFLNFSGDGSKIWWPSQCKLCKRHFYRATGATVFVWWTITDHGENPQLEVSLLQLPPLTFWLNVYMLNKVPCKG